MIDKAALCAVARFVLIKLKPVAAEKVNNILS